MYGVGSNQLVDELQHEQAQAQEKSALGAGGAAAGAAIGTVIFPVIGTALGAAIGGLASLFGGNRKPKPKVNPNLPTVPGIALPGQQAAAVPATQTNLLWELKQLAAQAGQSIQNALPNQIQQSNAAAGAAQRQAQEDARTRKTALLLLAGTVAFMAMKKRKGK